MCNVDSGKWMFNIGNDEVWTGEYYDSKQEAIEEGNLELEDSNRIRIQKNKEVIKSFNIGQVEKVYPCGVDVDFILENIAENTVDGMEAGEDYLCDVIDKHRAELEEKLNDVLFAWMKKYKYEPTFFRIVNIKEIGVDEYNG
jgi:hypothetical protein